MSPKVSLLRVGAFLLLSVVSAALFYSVVGLSPLKVGFMVGAVFMPPTPTVAWYAVWQTFATLFAVSLALGMYGVGERVGPKLSDALGEEEREGEREKAFVVLASGAAFAIPWLLRYAVLNDLPIADDESAYLFSARLLADFSLTVESPDFKLFYDRAFFVNDGRLFSQYFLGWPALLAPFTWIGLPEAANPIYSALTLPPLYLLTRRLLGPQLAKLCAVAWLASPFAMLAAATLLSHTTCTMGLVWGFYLVLRATDDDAPGWAAPAAMLAFCVAFWVRPFTAAMMATPWVLYMLWSWRRERPPAKVLLGTGGVVALLAAGFLAVNWHLTGSPFGTMYGEYLDYSRANSWRFSLWMGGDPEISTPDIRSDLGRYWLIGVALFRVFHSALGWPALGLLVLIGGLDKRLRLVTASLVLFACGLVATHSPGIDTIGPVHVMEMVPILLIMGLAGVATIARLAPAAKLATTVGIAALVVTSLATYWPGRVAAVEDATHVGVLPYAAVEQIESDPKKVIFASYPFVARCVRGRSAGFVFWRPMSSPQLDDDILWVNHITLELDRKFMAAEYPDREGYVMQWTQDCQLVLHDVRKPDLAIEPSYMGGIYDTSDLAAEFEESTEE